MSDSKDVVPKEVFARRASGLVREASLLDAFYVGFMNQGPPTALLTVFAWGNMALPIRGSAELDMDSYSSRCLRSRPDLGHPRGIYAQEWR
jgi:hypothetical protein